MTRTEHLEAAEQLLAEAKQVACAGEKQQYWHQPQVTNRLLAAQVHATLAQAQR